MTGSREAARCLLVIAEGLRDDDLNRAELRPLRELGSACGIHLPQGRAADRIAQAVDARVRDAIVDRSSVVLRRQRDSDAAIEHRIRCRPTSAAVTLAWLRDVARAAVAGGLGSTVHTTAMIELHSRVGRLAAITGAEIVAVVATDPLVAVERTVDASRRLAERLTRRDRRGCQVEQHPSHLRVRCQPVVGDAVRSALVGCTDVGQPLSESEHGRLEVPAGELLFVAWPGIAFGRSRRLAAPRWASTDGIAIAPWLEPSVAPLELDDLVRGIDAGVPAAPPTELEVPELAQLFPDLARLA